MSIILVQEDMHAEHRQLRLLVLTSAQERNVAKTRLEPLKSEFRYFAQRSRKCFGIVCVNGPGICLATYSNARRKGRLRRHYRRIPKASISL